MAVKGEKMKPFKIKIFLGGINGVGKTSLVNYLVSADHRIEACHGSKEFFKWLGIENGNYMKLESVPDEKKDIELEKMINCFIQNFLFQSSAKVWIFDGHFVRIHGETVSSAVGSWISNFDLIVFLTAEPSVIIERIRSDDFFGARKRSKLMDDLRSFPQPIDIIKKILVQVEDISEHLSKKFDIPLLKIDSSRKEPSELVAPIYNYINQA